MSPIALCRHPIAVLLFWALILGAALMSCQGNNQ
jgi:hypothetical protein